LAYAAGSGHSDAGELLLKSGASVDGKSSDGSGPSRKVFVFFKSV
jgi:ankyrin repeat protein